MINFLHRFKQVQTALIAGNSFPKIDIIDPRQQMPVCISSLFTGFDVVIIRPGFTDCNKVLADYNRLYPSCEQKGFRLHLILAGKDHYGLNFLMQRIKQDYGNDSPIFSLPHSSIQKLELLGYPCTDTSLGIRPDPYVAYLKDGTLLSVTKRSETDLDNEMNSIFEVMQRLKSENEKNNQVKEQFERVSQLRM